MSWCQRNDPPARFAGVTLACVLLACACKPSSPAASAPAPSVKPDASSANQPSDAQAADSGLRLADIDWPELTRDTRSSSPGNAGARAKDGRCKYLEARELSELDAAWAAAATGIAFSCTENDAGFRSAASLHLRENAATLFGRPATEIRQERSDRAISESAVLAGALTEQTQTLIDGLQARCRARHLGVPCEAERTQGEDNGVAYTRYRIEVGGMFYQLAQTADTPQRIVYLESKETF